jgi:H+/Cl- antiporter ClcA
LLLIRSRLCEFVLFGYLSSPNQSNFIHFLTLLKNDITSIISHLAQKDVISDWVGLVALLFAKFFFTLFSVGFTGCTAGVYSPVFITGAVFGRLAGELASVLFPDLDISPGAYAIVGTLAPTLQGFCFYI